jgi:hypothetical protein
MAAWMAHEFAATTLTPVRSASVCTDDAHDWRVKLPASGLDLIQLLADTALLTIHGRRA